jgi:FxLD family lantipeptide
MEYNPNTVEQDEDFGLDLTIVEADGDFANLMDATSDNCGSTRASACVTCV